MKPLPQEKVIPAVLRQAREDAGYDQASFGIRLQEMLGLKSPVASAAVSMWECGRRGVPDRYIDSICELLGVEKEKLIRQHDSKSDDGKYYVSWEDIALYDGQPLYIHFVTMEHEDGWAIVDCDHKRLVLKNQNVSFPKDKSSIGLWSVEPSSNVPDDVSSRPLSLSALMKECSVYVSMKTADKNVRAIYNGWYKHNEDSTALINNVGFILPYEGLNLSYVAYREVR